jgi:hypothetical protein
MTTSSTPTKAHHPGLVLVLEALAEDFVLALGILLDLGIMAVWAGDVVVFVLIAMGAAAPKALEGAVLGWIVWGYFARQGALIALILG